MRKLYKIAGICGVLLGSFALIFYYRTRAPIYSVSTLARLEKEIPTLDSQTLVVFDVDDVLVMNPDPFERLSFPQRSTDYTILSLYNLTSKLNTSVPRSIRDHIWYTYMKKFPPKILADDAPGIIKALQEKGIKVIALTGVWVNRDDEAVEDMRIVDLTSLGINFYGTFARYDNTFLGDCGFEGRSPTFKGGIVFTALACKTKGAVLEAFFKMLGWQPSYVIAIDDNRANLESIYDTLREKKIKYEGLWYRKALEFPASYDKQAAEFQLHYAIDHDQWLTIPQVRALLDQENTQKADCRCMQCPATAKN